MSAIERFENRFKTDRKMDFGPGDTIKVHVRVIEGEKERSQIFQGVVTNIRGSGSGKASRSGRCREASESSGRSRSIPRRSPRSTWPAKARSAGRSSST